MRTSTFFLVIIAMVIGITCLIAQKMGFEFGLGLDFSNSTILPKNEWNQNLIGKWKFNTRISNPTELWVFDGKAEYLENGEFIRQVTIKYYQDYHNQTPHEGENDLQIVAGGTIKGKWITDTITGNWKETAESCEIVNSTVKNGYNKEYNACQWFPPGGTIAYGNNTSSFSESEVKTFSEDKIDIQGKSFSDEGKKQWTFKRLK